MAGPRTTNETRDICGYTADVTGRITALSTADTYITDPEKRAVLIEVAGKIDAKNEALFDLYLAGLKSSVMAHRRAMGMGRALDRAFDRHVAHTAEVIRTGPSGGSRANEDYRKVFDKGTEAFQAPTIRDDVELAAELGRRLALLADFPQKQSLIDDNEKLLKLIGPASKAVIEGEEKISADFTTEVEARQAVIDELWKAKKTLEIAFKHDRALVRFIFFDFRKGGAADEPAPAEPPVEPT